NYYCSSYVGSYTFFF
nr:immunoglobulin light chain junction region [Macaca mulatta]